MEPQECKSQIIGVFDETLDVKTFRLKKPAGYSYKPGQHALLSFSSDANIQRPFTISSSPNNEFLEFTIKKVGEFTTKLFSAELGTNLDIGKPFGKNLVFDESVSQDAIFIAGGSGITPFLSSIRYASEKNLKNKISLFFANKTKSDIIQKPFFEKVSADNKNFKFIPILSSADSTWTGETGYMTINLITKYIKNPSEKIWYICGPPMMNKSVLQLLQEIKIPAENIRFEKWDNAQIAVAKEEKMTEKYEKYKCTVCGYIYDEEKGDPDSGISPKTKWKDVPDTWVCPDCGVGKENFELMN